MLANDATLRQKLCFQAENLRIGRLQVRFGAHGTYSKTRRPEAIVVMRGPGMGFDCAGTGLKSIGLII